MSEKFKNIKKKHYIVEGGRTYYQKDNKTICVLNCAIPTNHLIPEVLDVQTLRTLRKRFPSFRFLYRKTGPVITFIVKGKAVCADGDSYNEELGRTIAHSKAKAKAYAIVNKIANEVANNLSKWQINATYVSEFFKIAQERELNFVNNI